MKHRILTVIWLFGLGGWGLLQNQAWGQSGTKLPVSIQQKPTQAVDAKKEAQALLQRGNLLLKKMRYSRAARLFKQALERNSNSRLIRKQLAHTYIRLGDRFATRHNDRELQRRFYEKALGCSPVLVEDRIFLKRYRKLQTWRPRRKPLSLGTRSQSQMLRDDFLKQDSLRIGAGLSMGIEGVFGVQVELLLAGRWNAAVTFSPLFQTINLSLRFLPFREQAWTPYLSLGGMLQTTIWPNEVPLRFEGPVIHGGFGVHYTSRFGFTFLLGINLAFGPLGEGLSFLPLPTTQISWYF